jgi:hydrogenase maturation factor HypF (carbamoyltransferase family)
LEFKGNGGLKIDMEFIGDEFNYSALVGSVISFKLAGADDFYIAYSIFEAFGDMAISTINQLKKKFRINNIVMMGDMFGNSVLYSRILSKYQLANPFFSKQFALDD